ncbi:ATP-binding protein [Streptomyces orinoci]|uniref:ATP-binding protein n=1 Tax=Streptomyces orinoci TaxID=67339 RepID=A0ABV3K7K6_STRON|nr:ATP-binding protein [Streptomyces orinoci]
MPVFSRDTLRPPHMADALYGAGDLLAGRPAAPRRLLGHWDQGAPVCIYAPPARWNPPARPADGPSRAISLPASPRSVAAARRFCDRLLAEWGLHDLAGDALLLLSELVTNAIVHGPEGAGDVELTLSRTPARLIAQVTDGGGSLPRCGRAGPDSENGRGMWLVEQIADEWGHHLSPAGKTVWFTLPLPSAHPA